MEGHLALRRWWLDIAVAALVVGAIGWILSPYFVNAWNAPAARRQLLAFTSEVKPGISRDDVRAHFGSMPREFLELHEVDTTLTLVQTPLMFGARDWNAWLDFTDGRLSSIRIRTADSQYEKPEGSPPDVGTPPPAHHR